MSKAGEHQHSDAVGSDSSLSVDHRPHAGRAWARCEVDLVAGIFLLVFAGLAWWFGQPLKFGTAFRMGPGFVPILLSWTMGAFGIALIAMGLIHRGPALEGWRLKPIALVLGAMGLAEGASFAIPSWKSFGILLVLAAIGHCLSWILISRSIAVTLPETMLPTLMLSKCPFMYFSNSLANEPGTGLAGLVSDTPELFTLI